MKKLGYWSVVGLFFGILLVGAIEFGGVGGCGGTGGGGGGVGATRGITGTLSASSLPALTVQGKSQQLACTDLQVCCGAYDGSLLVASVGSDCTFTLSLPLNNFCYCAVFSDADADGNGCGDNYLASLGCSENGYGGAIPIFPDADGSTDKIDFGTGSTEGKKVVATGNPCAQVDQDDDGTVDSEDSDDDDDGILDGSDNLNSIGCENADELDSDENNVPDIYEGLWGNELAALKLMKGQGTSGELAQAFADSDDDNIPDFCDVDFGCAPDEFDTDGDCIPDDFDKCADTTDDDGNGNPDNDNDGDGINICQDCDDEDPQSGIDCYDCSSDEECRDVVESVGGSQAIQDQTACNTSTGSCETNCRNASPDIAICEDTCIAYEDEGATLDDKSGVCTFPFAL